MVTGLAVQAVQAGGGLLLGHKPHPDNAVRSPDAEARTAGSVSSMTAPVRLRKATVRANDLEFGLLEAGSGPLALCLHGFPDTAWTWEHLLPALAGASI